MADVPQIDADLLDMLRCPVALKEHGKDAAQLQVVHNGWWLVNETSGCKYPVRNGIPHMVVEEGKQWQSVAIDDLPVPPPDEDA